MTVGFDGTQIKNLIMSMYNEMIVPMYNEKYLRECAAEWIIKDEQPFTNVEENGFCKSCNVLKPWFSPIYDTQSYKITWNYIQMNIFKWMIYLAWLARESHWRLIHKPPFKIWRMCISLLIRLTMTKTYRSGSLNFSTSNIIRFHLLEQSWMMLWMSSGGLESYFSSQLTMPMPMAQR